jgi:DNA-binding transcriptional regulator PaaX
MKLPFTEKFLLDVYNYIEKIDKTFDIFAYRTIEEAYCPSLYELRNQYKRKQTKQQFNQLIYRLKKKGYIKIKNLEQNKGVILTKKGAEKVLKVKFKTKDNKKRSDKKWQMIIFDIPEKKRYSRDLLREKLIFLKYKMLQQSIWICPYDVQKETNFILRKYSLDPYIKLFLIEEIEL